MNVHHRVDGLEKQTCTDSQTVRVHHRVDGLENL